jgi:hypothetical protein
VLCWCSSMSPCCVVLVFVNTYLMCFLACWRLRYLFDFQCLLAPTCYVLLLLIGASLLCFIGVFWVSKLVFPLAFFYANVCNVGKDKFQASFWTIRYFLVLKFFPSVFLGSFFSSFFSLSNYFLNFFLSWFDFKCRFLVYFSFHFYFK